MEVKDLRRKVARRFYDLVDENANPLVVALALQDNSSVGLQRHTAEFHDLHEEIKDFLKSRVDESYGGFIESAGVYRYVVEALKTSNEGLQGTKSQLLKVQDQLQNRKSDIKDLHRKSTRFKRKLEILSHLEMLQQLPSKYEACIARKEFTEARQMLEHVLEVFNLRNLLNHPSIQPLIGYVQTQQVQLVFRLSEELRATVYLEDLHSQKRLEYSKTLLTENTDYAEFMKNLPVLPEVNPSSPEVNTFSYLGYVMQTLAGLGGLADTLDNLHRQVHYDLKKLVQTSTQQVIKDLRLTPESIQRVVTRQTLLDQFKLIDQNALTVLAKTLFTRLAKVLEAQSVVAEVARLFGIAYNLDGICDAVLNTLRDFLLEYIGGQLAPARLKAKKPQVSSISDNASKFSKSIHVGPVFEFGPGDEDSKSLRDFETLRESLKKSVPGLLAADPHHLFAETREKQKLEVVAPAHILNIRPLLEPSAALLAKAKTLSKSEKYRNLYDYFLDRFLQQSFVPKLQESFEEAIIGISEDETALDQMADYRSKSQLPIVNCAGQFAETVGLLSQILDAGTNFRAEYAEMLIGLIESVTSYFQTQVTNLFDQNSAVNSHSGRGAFRFSTFMAQPALQEALKKRMEGHPDLNTEFNVYFSKRYSPRAPAKSAISIQDLLDMNMFRKAALLITSIRWFTLRLQKMRHVDMTEIISKSDDMSVRVRRRWTLLDASSNFSSLADFSLLNSRAVLSGKSLQSFDAAVNKLEKCAFSALSTLRTDLFLRIIYYFDQMVINRDYHSTNRGEERDPVVDRLQHELSLESQIFEEHLLPSDCSFLIGDIAEFMTQLFILEGENIKDVNESGQNQILTNIFALQQMLTAIVADPREVDFSRASSFYELFRLNPTLIIDKARDGETDLGYQDLKLLLEIRHRNAGNTSTSHAFGTLSHHLSQLKYIFNGNLSSNAPGSNLTNAPLSQSHGNETESFFDSATTPSATIPSSAQKTSTAERSPGNNSASNVPHSPAQADAQRLREERRRALMEQQKQKEMEQAQIEHEARNSVQAERLRRDREELKSRSQNFAQTSSDGQPSAREPDNSLARPPQTTAAPAPQAARSPLLNHRLPRFSESHNNTTPPAQPQAEQPQAIESVPQAPSHAVNAKNVSQSYNNGSTGVSMVSSQVQPLRQKASSQALPKINASLARTVSREGNSPITPDQQTTSQARVRSPSERALEAAQRVRVRQMPQPQPRKPSN